MNYSVSAGDKYKSQDDKIISIRGMATHTELMEGLVIYYDSEKHIWATPVEKFFGYTNEGLKRFTLIVDEDDE